MQIKWRWLEFSGFDADTLYRVLALRTEVFVVEQNCAYLETDGLDQTAWHLLAQHDSDLIAYLRYLPSSAEHQQPAIGRVVVHQEYRGRGLARELMQRGLDFAADQRSGLAVKISAQVYLANFYRSLGFVTQGDAYLEDGIPHIDMHYPGTQDHASDH